MKSWTLAFWVLCTALALGGRVANADHFSAGRAGWHVVQVDEDDEDRGWGYEHGDGDWAPLWFGLRFLAPPRRVIIEHHYSYSEAPPAYTPPPQNYWYYCQDPEGYYPQVQSCPEGWMRVVPNGGPPR